MNPVPEIFYCGVYSSIPHTICLVNERVGVTLSYLRTSILPYFHTSILPSEPIVGYYRSDWIKQLEIIFEIANLTSWKEIQGKNILQ